MEQLANKTQVAGSVVAVRREFLNAVGRLVLHVLQDLRSHVLTCFQALFRIGVFPTDRDQSETGYIITPAVPGGPVVHALIRWRDSNDVPRWESEFANVAADPARAHVKNAVDRWGAKWNLTDPWILDAALDTLVCWLQHPANDDQNWHPRPNFLSGDNLPPRLVINEAWWFQPWDDFHSRIQEKIAGFKVMIEDFCARTGYDPDARVHGRYYHYEWLALYQCKKLSPSAIQLWHKESHGEWVVESTITHAIESLAARIGLTKRPSRRGKKQAKYVK